MFFGQKSWDILKHFQILATRRQQWRNAMKLLLAALSIFNLQSCISLYEIITKGGHKMRGKETAVGFRSISAQTRGCSSVVGRALRVPELEIWKELKHSPTPGLARFIHRIHCASNARACWKKFAIPSARSGIEKGFSLAPELELIARRSASGETFCPRCIFGTNTLCFPRKHVVGFAMPRGSVFCVPPSRRFFFFRGAETQLKNESKTSSFQRAEIDLGEILELLKEVDIGISRISPGSSHVRDDFPFLSTVRERSFFALHKAIIEHHDSRTLPLKQSKTYRSTIIYGKIGYQVLN